MEMLEQNSPMHFERNARNMIAAARAHEVDTLLMTFVTSTNFDNPVVASDEYIFALDQNNEVTRQIAQSTGTPIYDLENTFPDDDSLYTDGRHMNGKGNRVRAELIGDYIIREFLSK